LAQLGATRRAHDGDAGPKHRFIRFVDRPQVALPAAILGVLLCLLFGIPAVISSLEHWFGPVFLSIADGID
jgi:hypothetical protein